MSWLSQLWHKEEPQLLTWAEHLGAYIKSNVDVPGAEKIVIQAVTALAMGNPAGALSLFQLVVNLVSTQLQAKAMQDGQPKQQT